MLYDGGPLIFAPDGPSALHLLEILEILPVSVDPWLALPGETNLLPTCDRLHVVIEPARGWLRWEQVILPSLIRRTQADLLHVTTFGAPFFSPAPCIISPAEPFGTTANAGLIPRLSESLGRGGFSRSRLVLWPNDLPEPDWSAMGVQVPLASLPPLVHSVFYRPQSEFANLPYDFVFCPGPLRDEDIASLAAAWRWAGTGLGENYSVLLEDLSPKQINRLEMLLEQMGIRVPVHSIHLRNPAERAFLIQNAAEVLCLGSTLAWGDPLLHALACERPIVAVETPYSDSRIGPAGYLAPPGDARLLGAAILTPLIEETVQGPLIAAARERAAAWQSDRFSEELEKAYRRATAT